LELKKGLASLPDLLYLIIREDTKEKLEQDPEIAVIGCAGSGKEIEKLKPMRLFPQILLRYLKLR